MLYINKHYALMQPPYSRDTGYSDEFFAYKMKLLDECAEDADVIVLPEYSDVPCATATLEETLFYWDVEIPEVNDN